MIKSIILILLLMVCDRVRGGGLHFDGKAYELFRKVCQFGYGAILGYMISPDNGYLIIACSVLWWLGEKPSWRKLFNELSGLAPEEDYLFLRFMLRGLIWAAPCLPLAYFDMNILWLSTMALAFPLSAYWGYRWQETFDEHAVTELTRPMILGLIITMVVMAII